MEQFVKGVREFAASIVNLKPLKSKLRILKEISGKMVTVKLQSRILTLCTYSQVPTG